MEPIPNMQDIKKAIKDSGKHDKKIVTITIKRNWASILGWLEENYKNFDYIDLPNNEYDVWGYAKKTPPGKCTWQILIKSRP
jgi:hypothetical protein